jgi:hypothetical protein
MMMRGCEDDAVKRRLGDRRAARERERVALVGKSKNNLARLKVKNHNIALKSSRYI